MKNSRVAIIVAAHNEEHYIATVVRDIKKSGHKWIIVVDDGSRDKTSALAQAAGAIVLRHIVNLGKGAAMRTGAEYALANGADALIFLDGDGQHRPEELKLFTKELDKGYAAVFGRRTSQTQMPLVLRFGNWFISSVIRVLYGLDLHDSQCGYRALTVDAFKKVRWRSRDYSVESEMIARTGKTKLKYREIPISTIYHDKYKGTTPLDGFPIVWNLIWWRIAL